MRKQISSTLKPLNACQRNWVDDSVSQENLDLLIQVAHATPTKQNVNFFQCIIFTDPTAKEELFDICHSEGFKPDMTPNIAPGAVKLLQVNKEFIKREGAAWIQNQVRCNDSEFNGYKYEAHKCYRDIGFLVESYIKDLKTNSNENTRRVVSKYFDNRGHPLVRQKVEIETHKFLQHLIVDNILKNIKIGSLQDLERQVIIPEIIAEPTNIIDLTNIIINVLESGLEAMPEVIEGIKYEPRNQLNYNTQLLAPVVFMWTANKDESYTRLFDKEYDTEVDLVRHQSLNVGISSGAVAMAAHLLGYKTGFCGCYNPTNISKWLSVKHGIETNNFPVAILGIGTPDPTKVSNLCVDVEGNHFLRNRRTKDRPVEIMIK